MIIRSFSIDRFGILAGQKVAELSPGLNIFLGDNEAGKSTLLRFFRAMFFGYKRGKQDLDYQSSAAAAAFSGGSLRLESSRGAVFNLIRRPGKHGGPLTLSDASGKSLPPSYLSELLSGYTDKMYDEVFCFGYKELSSLDGLNKDEVAGVLHSAAFGLGFNSPVRVNRELAERQKELFTQRAKGSRIQLLFSDLEKVRRELAHLGAEQGRYGAIKAEQEELGTALAALKDEILDASLELERRHSLSGAWEDWEKLLAARAALELNPHPGGDFALENMERFDDLLRRLEEARAGRLELLERIRQGSAGVQRLNELAPLEGVWRDCERLLSRKAKLEKAIAETPRLESALAESRAREAALARALGWSVEKALAFDITLGLQKGLEHWRGELKAAQSALDEAGQRARDREEDARKLAENAARERRGLGQSVDADGGSAVASALYGPEARARLERSGRSAEAAGQGLDTAQKALDDIIDEEVRLAEERSDTERELAEARALAGAAAEEARRARPRPLFSLNTARKDTRRVLPLLVCLALAMLCFANTYQYFNTTRLGQDSWLKFTSLAEWKIYLELNWRVFGLGLAFLWGTFYWLAPRAATLGLWRPRNPWEALLSPAEREALTGVDNAVWRFEALEERRKNLDAAREKAASELDALSGAAAAAREEWSRQAAFYALHPDCAPDAALRIFDLDALAAQAAQKAREAAIKAAQASQARDAARDAWTEWLARQGFEADFTPDTLPHALQYIKDIQAQAEASAEREAALVSALEERKSFSRDLEALYARASFKPEGTPEGAEPGQSFDSLWVAVQAAHEESVLLKGQPEELRRLEAEFAGYDDLLLAREERFAALLKQGGAADEADYRLRFGQYLAHAALRLEEGNIAARLELAAAKEHAASGRKLWKDAAGFMAALRATGPESLHEEAESVKSDLAALEEKQAEMQSRQGENRARLEALESGKSAEELQAREAALRDELKALAHQWGVAVMAQNFIREAQRGFEEGRHDSVISQAGVLLSRLTNGRYKKLLFDLGGKGSAYAINAGGESLDSASALSRGTREQLYLALRLAFISQQNTTQESLPLIMDDILVNFDSERAASAAKIFAEFSAVNQGLFFTCHPYVAELLKRTAPQSKLFSIAAGRIGQVTEK